MESAEDFDVVEVRRLTSAELARSGRHGHRRGALAARM